MKTAILTLCGFGLLFLAGCGGGTGDSLANDYIAAIKAGDSAKAKSLSQQIEKLGEDDKKAAAKVIENAAKADPALGMKILQQELGGAMDQLKKGFGDMKMPDLKMPDIKFP